MQGDLLAGLIGSEPEESLRAACGVRGGGIYSGDLHRRGEVAA